MGGRAGGGASGGMGSRSRSGANQPRMTLQKGTKDYEKAQLWASDIMEAGNFNRSDYIYQNDYSFRKGNSVSAAINHKMNVENANHEWDDNYKYLSKALGHVSKHGNDFEKAVAASISKTMKKSTDKAKQVAFVSSKQSWVISKSLVETHWNGKY